MDPDADLYRLYEHVGADGYPPEWHETIKHLVREEAGHRCVRCGHPYSKGDGEWSACDQRCTHGGPLRAAGSPLNAPSASVGVSVISWLAERGTLPPDSVVEAQWRILTVHHLNGDKADCRWWNLASLCQRCHLRIQRTVVMPRVFPWEHSEWFKPYAAGWYAHVYLGEDLTREETLERLDELLALERIA